MSLSQPTPGPMPRKPRVMLVGPWPPTVGGVTTFMLNIANSPLAGSYEFIRFTTTRPKKRNVSRAYGYRAMLRDGFFSFAVSASITLWHVAKFPFAVLFERPDVVQVQASDFQAFWEAAIYVGFCRIFSRPVLMRIGGSFDQFYRSSPDRARAAINRVLLWPDRLIVQAESWAEFVRTCGRREGIVILPNMVSPEFAAVARRPNRCKIVCLFIAGTEAVWKGVEEVIAVIRIFRAKGSAVRFRILAASADLERRLCEEQLTDVTDVEGFVAKEGVIAAIQQSDIFLLPSYGEGFPNSLLEAMAGGLAAIVTPVGSVPEIVGDDGAVIVQTRDVGALADAIEKLAGDEDFRARIAWSGRARVSARYTRNAVLPILAEAWQSLLAPGSTPANLRSEAGRIPGSG